MLTVAVSSAGDMGSALGARLVENGVAVLVDLSGRSEASRARAHAAGLKEGTLGELLQADIFLSVMPPGEALAYTLEIAAALRKEPSPGVVFADCNAINPDSAQKAAEIIESAGAKFVDASIVGFPPKRGGSDNPVIFASGAFARRLDVLNNAGLKVRVLDAPIGAASAVKMCYGGLTKGLMGLAAALILAADRLGAGEALREELVASQPQLYPWLERMMPNVYTKSARWVAEMNEVEGMLGAREEHLFFAGAAGLFKRVADEQDSEAGEIAQLMRFFAERDS